MQGKKVGITIEDSSAADEQRWITVGAKKKEGGGKERGKHPLISVRPLHPRSANLMEKGKRKGGRKVCLAQGENNAFNNGKGGGKGGGERAERLLKCISDAD